MSTTVSHEFASALGADRALDEPGQRAISINREGSGHTLTANDTVGAVILGAISIILLVALLRAEKRNRDLQSQVRAIVA